MNIVASQIAPFRTARAPRSLGRACPIFTDFCALSSGFGVSQWTSTRFGELKTTYATQTWMLSGQVYFAAYEIDDAQVMLRMFFLESMAAFAPAITAFVVQWQAAAPQRRRQWP